MNSKIINADIIIMSLFSILLFMAIIDDRLFFFTDYQYIPILYTVVKSIFGIIILVKQFKNKSKPIHGKSYLLYLLPSVIALFSLIAFSDILLLLVIMIYPIISFIGILMWLIYWTLYDARIKVWKILLVNTTTPLYLILFIAMLAHYGP